MISIVPFTKEYSNDFKRLNLEWLEKFNLTEPADFEILDDPIGKVIDQDGFIWLALEDDEIVGSAALVKISEGKFELAKMAVTESSQGRGIGKLLLEKCLESAKESAALEIILFSNSQLASAIKLYEKYGFRHIEVENSPYQTADVEMSLHF